MTNSPASSPPRAARPREYRIEPRFLAGSTHTGDPGLLPLLDAGWALSRDDLGNVLVTSPDHTVRLGFLPEGERGDLWMITAHADAFAPPEWQVTLDLSAPPEIVGEFTAALAATHSAAPSSVLHGDTGGWDMTDHLLDKRGWRLEGEGATAVFRSPDGLLALHKRLGYLRPETEMAGDAERWTVEVGPPGHRWYATATSNLPDHLLDTLTTAIASPAPVQRYLRPSELAHLPSQATATPTAPSPLEVARIRAATARSTPTPRASASALAYTTATRSAVLPTPALTGRAR
ncbi:DUF317 domain-containing protein [Kitasatospora sp. NBC_01287]|uniref:DUF317 domain-containing protein n=1 Tax=Kitasatospora sp. NBC_01287 TaxID=2903573 RepID=UPI002253D20D|nr:DUF317 domain-containing protein [Kitasatospora sp. NBC_01287]MCX4751242.1 DUF317 domain-containing protein [Kitasatospora sp. NBC_01287]